MHHTCPWQKALLHTTQPCYLHAPSLVNAYLRNSYPGSSLSGGELLAAIIVPIAVGAWHVHGGGGGSKWRRAATCL